MNNKSFTLIELLVVIVIIGILAGVIMISTSSSIDKANIAKLKVFEESVANNLAANMVSRWKLDQINYPAANQTPDAWGLNTGTLYGTNGLPQLRPSSECVSDSCLLFDGTDDYIDHGNNSSLNFGINAFSLGLWVNASTQTEVYPAILDKSAGTDWTGTCAKSGFWLGNRSSSSVGNYLLQLGDGTVTGSTSPDNVSFGDLNNKGWTYIVATIDAAGNSSLIKAYKNGALTSFNNRTLQGSIDSTYNFNIGQWRGYTRNFNGLIDDVRIYNAALSPSQIKQNYIAGLESLLAKGSISKEDYNQRINELAYGK